MSLTRESITLQQLFDSINHSAAPVITADKQNTQVLTYDHAMSIVKRFAADDAAVYRVLSGRQSCPYTEQEALAAESSRDRAAFYYNSVYKTSGPARRAARMAIDLTSKYRLLLDRGSGYESTYHLMDLICEALFCRNRLSPNFPRADENAEASVSELSARLDKQQRVRFPLFDAEVEALKNLALPSNPRDARLTDPETLMTAYEAEFKRLTKKPPPPPAPPRPPSTVQYIRW